MDSHAHGLQRQHTIFNKPFQVNLTFVDRTIHPIYRAYYEGRKMGKKIPMWKVQTEGYKDGKGFPAGTVIWPHLGNTPDSEIICSGQNMKRPDAVAIGRQGNFLHWGFSASPDFLTTEAKQVFINSIHYIHQFKEKTSVTQKVEKLVTRRHLDDVMWAISDEGFSVLESIYKDYPKVNPSRIQIVETFVSSGIRKKFKNNWESYRSHFKTNRQFLYPEPKTGGWQKLIVDQDAKALGIPNSDIRILETCISMLGDRNQTELANRVLQRYTGQSFTSEKQWSAWFSKNRNNLVFSDPAGFKFLVFPTNSKPPKRLTKSSKRQVLGPVRFWSEMKHLGGERWKLRIHVSLDDGWHLYAATAPNSAYTPTTIKIAPRKGVKKIGEWKYPKAVPYALEEGTKTFAGPIVFEQVLQITEPADKEIEIELTFQACKHERCLPPSTKKLKILIPK